MSEPDVTALIDELAFLDAWESGLLPAVSGLTRVRQFQRAYSGQIDVCRQLLGHDRITPTKRN